MAQKIIKVTEKAYNALKQMPGGSFTQKILKLCEPPKPQNSILPKAKDPLSSIPLPKIEDTRPLTPDLDDEEQDFLNRYKSAKSSYDQEILRSFALKRFGAVRIEELLSMP